MVAKNQERASRHNKKVADRVREISSEEKESKKEASELLENKLQKAAAKRDEILSQVK